MTCGIPPSKLPLTLYFLVLLPSDDYYTKKYRARSRRRTQYLTSHSFHNHSHQSCPSLFYQHLYKIRSCSLFFSLHLFPTTTTPFAPAKPICEESRENVRALVNLNSCYREGKSHGVLQKIVISQNVHNISCFSIHAHFLFIPRLLLL